MSSSVATAKVAPNAQAILTKAVIRSARILGITNRKLANIIGVSPSTVTRLHSEGSYLVQGRKEWEMGVLFVRMFRSLDAIVGDTGTRAWLESENSAFANRKPVDLIETAEGLVHVTNYLDAHRGII
jgi:uncharacterized protein (DUF2384 family)